MDYPRLMLSTLLAAGMCGCATQQPLSSTQGITVLRTGHVTAVRDVAVNTERDPGVGAMIGTILGGVAGSNIGGGNGRIVAAIGGAIAGNAAGRSLENSAATRTMTELTIRFDTGEVHTFTVEPGASYRIGDQVTVSTHQGVTRVTR